MVFDRIEYYIGEMSEAPQKLTVESSGRANYESHTNIATPDRPELGKYEIDLPTATVQSLQNRLSDPPFKDMPDHWERVLSGQRNQRVRLVVGTAQWEKLIGPSHPVDPRMSRLLAELDAIVERVAASPCETLRLGVNRAAVDSQRTFTATLVLSNSGTRPTRVRHPGDLLHAPDGELVLQFWPDKPPGQLTADDWHRANVQRVTEVEIPRSKIVDQRVIELPPGGSAKFQIHAEPDFEKGGPFLIRIVYGTTAEVIDDRRPLIGQLLSLPQKIDVPVR